MNPIKVAIGFVPLILFGALVGRIPVGWSAAVGLVAALAVVATTARGGIKILPVAQAVALLVMAVAGFLGGAMVNAFLESYGPGATSLLLGTFIVTTAGAMPFTAQFARAAVPPSAWRSPLFLRINRHLSLAWGLAVLALGVCHLVGGYLGAHDAIPIVRFVVTWLIPVIALLLAISFTHRITGQHASASASERTNRARP